MKIISRGISFEAQLKRLSVFDSVSVLIVSTVRVWTVSFCDEGFSGVSDESIVTSDDIQMLHEKINRGNVITVYSSEHPFLFFREN